MAHAGNFKVQDLTGNVYGLLTVVERADNNEFGLVYWRLACVCGEVVERRANTLRSGKFFTCGKPACRFFEKVNMNGPLMPGMETNCYVWTGATKDTGYGVMKMPGEKLVVRAHVFAYDMLHDDRAGRWVLHKCDNRVCVRDEHLFPGTHAENMVDMAAKGRGVKAGGRVYLSTEEKVQMAVIYKQGGVSHADLAERFGVSLQTVGRLLRRAAHKE